MLHVLLMNLVFSNFCFAGGGHTVVVVRVLALYLNTTLTQLNSEKPGPEPELLASLAT